MLREYLSNIADKFRTYLDTTEPINAQDFAGKVEDVAVRYNQLGFTNGYNLGLEEGKPLGKLELLQDSEYMNAKVSGTAIAVNDVHKVEHNVGVQLKSKNLLNVGNRTIRRMGSNQLNFVENSIYTDIARNGVYVHTNVTHDISNPQQIMVNSNSNAFGLAFNFKVKPNETYTVNCSNFDNSKQSIGIGFFTEGGASISHFAIGEYPNTTVPKTFSTPANSYWLLVVLTVTSSATNQNIIFENVQLELGTTATAYTPYVEELGGIEVSRYGKNLLPYPYSHTTKTVNGITFTDNGDGTITVNGTATANADFYLQYSFNIKKGMYVSSGTNGDSDSTYELFVNGFDGTILRSYGNNKCADHDFVANVFLRVRLGAVVKDLIFKPQLEYNTVATPYEPYIKPTTYQSTADGTVEGVKSISPNMTLLSNNNGVVINANYLRDIDTYIDNLITNVALSGGEA